MGHSSLALSTRVSSREKGRTDSMLGPSSESNFSNTVRTTSTLLVLVVLTVVAVVFVHDASVGHVMEEASSAEISRLSYGDAYGRQTRALPKVRLGENGEVSTSFKGLQTAMRRVRRSDRRMSEYRERKAKKVETSKDQMPSRLRQMVQERNTKFEMRKVWNSHQTTMNSCRHNIFFIIGFSPPC